MPRSPLKLVPRLALVSALLLGAVPARAEDTAIHTIVAVATEGGCASALGYVVEVGERDKVREAAEQKLLEQFPTRKVSNHKDNDKKGKPLGRYLVVLSAGVTKGGCTGRAMGVGFGADEASAKKDAKKDLGKHFPFNDGALKVEHSKGY
ncbi:hypothetical protein [Pyxidicoccus xibeiensis]|uniref:hypothetical protein n=1 Tax=Pyxidicoccus xibeiensis TaxID=2906759 RepID=UPI0020A77531|nr:hypothetical protein [Pyxidicoccus xibeiensis]MCP3140860.1 hypothetical protein [Pyxidicoccus xibeiensis]